MLTAELSHAIRRLARTPGFTAVAILTLALGIGANSALFSLLKTVVLQPLPYGQPDRLVMIWDQAERGRTTWLSAHELRGYGNDAPSIQEIAAYTTLPSLTGTNLTGGQEPERVAAAAVTPNLIGTLGVAAMMGRTFDVEGAPSDLAAEVVLGHGLWQRRFAGAADVVGQTIMLDGRPRTVVGVMPASFRLPLDFDHPRPIEIWTPLDVEPLLRGEFGSRSLIAIARLREGTSAARATGELRLIEDRWRREGLVSARDELRRNAIPVQDLVVGDVRNVIWTLFGAVGIILLIACANVANLLLARTDERHRELAIRTAIGATHGRLVRQLLTESVLLGVAGGALGVAVAWAGIRVVLAVNPVALPRVGEVSLDPGVLVFTLVLSVATGLLFGAAPALEIRRPDLSRALKDGGRTGSVGRGRQRFRDALVVAQTACSVVLLIGAGLLLRTFVELRRIDPGFDSRNVLTARVSLPQQTYSTRGDVVAFYDHLLAGVRDLPGVRAAGATRLLPLTGTIGDWSITIEGREPTPGANPNGDWQVVAPGYFETMGIRLVRGRFLETDDHADSPLSAVINQTMAERYWPGENVVGKRFHLGTADQPWVTIVGVAAQVRHNAIVEAPRAEMYMTHSQFPVARGSLQRTMTLVIRTAGEPLALVPHLRRAVRALDPNLPLADLRTLQSVADDALSGARFTTLLLGLFATLAFALATIGIYSVISLLVTRRRQEIGIRIALGAGARRILAMVVGRGVSLAAAGVLAGLGLAFVSTRVLASALHGVTVHDPTIFLAVPAVLVAVAILACLVPAARATRVDPMTALREE